MPYTPSMFPSAASGDGDRNRSVRYWRPGEPVPTAVRVAFVLLIVCAIGLLLSGMLMWTADPPETADPDRQRAVDAVATALRWVGSAQIVGAVVLSVTVPGLLRGDARRRLILLVTAILVILVSLGSWVIGVGGVMQPVLALLLAVAALAMYRPAVKTFFGQRTGEDR